jgi:DNA invertase Pin-like site-specific DNA recombinase
LGLERDLIRVRTAEGRERARACGVKLGRKPMLTQHPQKEAINLICRVCCSTRAQDKQRPANIATEQGRHLSAAVGR